MKVTAPLDAYVPDIGQVVKGDEYDVPDKVGKSLAAQGWKTSGGSKPSAKAPSKAASKRG